MTPDNKNIIEGRHPVAEALKAKHPIHKVYTLQKVQNGNPQDTLVQLVTACVEQGAKVQYLKREKLDQMATSHAHQGIIAEVTPYTCHELFALLDKIEAENPTPFLLLLDGLKDPHNLGSILRIADGAGIDAVVLPERRSVSLSAIVAKTSAGAIHYVPVATVTNLSQTVLALKKRGYWIYAADAAGDRSYFAADWNGKIAVIIGSEGKGIGAKLLNHADFKITIPQYGKVNSLNASVACGIITFAAAAKRREQITK